MDAARRFAAQPGAHEWEGRLHVVEEWPEQVTRWDPATGEQAVVLHNSEYEASGPIEGIAINSAGDIYFSECKRDRSWMMCVHTPR